ncbi:codanin-1-like [Asterias amurensis]|uniref:codanin-1-like n=1 Tax=Asterias amurensis TaxID=7602 RepID=UPI003AB4B1E0
MAAVLEAYLAGSISSKSLVSWLLSTDTDVSALTEINLFNDRSLRVEFLPFFINYLRDQTAHLICHGASSGASPAKTPASAQKFRRASLQRQNSTDLPKHQESGVRSNHQRVNRTKLFSPSPLRSDGTEVLQTPKSEASEDGSPLSNSTESPSWNQGGQFYRKSQHDEYSGKAKKVSPSVHKKDEQITLGQYITPDRFSQPKGRRRSDQHHLKEGTQHKTPVATKHRSGGKNKTSYSDGSLKSKSKPVCREVAAPEFSLNDAMDFPAVGIASKIKDIPTKRITPTAVSSSHQKSISKGKLFSSPGQPTFSNPAFQAGFSAPGNSTNTGGPIQTNQGLDKERELLRLERRKQQASLTNTQESSVNNAAPCPSTAQPQTPTKTSPNFAFTYTTEVTKASREGVTYQDHLEKLAELYSACIKDCLMPNLTMELYFLVHLLTARGSVSSTEGINDRCDPEDINYLCSLHNCVYFAVQVLHQQMWLLVFLDKTTLKLLAEVPHLSEFSPTLRPELEKAIDGGTSRPVVVTSKSPVQAVPFMADTDNRRNFPSDVSFHSFRKQRDKFYEFVREWMDYHNLPEWNMKTVMAKKIRELVQQIVEVANCTHFARLFRSQLTRMCQGDHLLSDNDDSKDRGFLGELKKTNPERFKRLEERFFTPTTSGGPSPRPGFHGCQDFFKEFILAADSFLLNQHLMDNFSNKILELNEMQFGLTDQDGDTDSNGVDDEAIGSFSVTLQAARVLAKFLGFLVFLPYQRGGNLPDSVQADMISIRNKCSPPLDLLSSLRSSCQQHRLVMTIPWVVEYLSMMDPEAAQLDSLQVLLRLLVQVYRTVSKKLCVDSTNYNMLLVLLLLGWLFEVPGMPASMYFTSFADDFINDDTIMQSASPNTPLDELCLVDQQLLYLCCPYLGDIRVLLTDASLGFGSKTTPMKKITPIWAGTPPKPIQTSQQLQQELEKNFFDNHSPSLKKTVDFVSSRLYSNCIKHIDAKIVLASRRTVVELLDSEIKSEEIGTVKEDWTDKMKSALLRLVKAKTKEVIVATRREAEEQAKQFVRERSKKSLSLLLPQETCEQVLEAAAGITTRLAMERAKRWCNEQIPAAIQQELNTGVDKAIRAAKKEAVEKPKLIKPLHHDRNLLSPSSLLQGYKDLLRHLLSGSLKQDVKPKELASLLATTRQVLHARQDLTVIALQMIQQLSIDLLAALVIFHPDCLDSSIDSRDTVASLPSIKNDDDETRDSLAVEPNGTPEESSSFNSTESVTAESENQTCYNESKNCNGHKPRSDMRLLDVFLELWRDHFECRVPVQTFLCPRNTMLIENSANPKVRWDSLSSVTCKLIDNKLLDPTRVAESLTRLMESEYWMTETMIAALWTIIQYISQVESQDESSMDIEPMLNILMSRCPEGPVLQRLCDYMQHQERYRASNLN